MHHVLVRSGVESLEARRLQTSMADPYPPLPDIDLLPRPISGFTYAAGRAEMTFEDGVLSVFGTAGNDLLRPVIRDGRLSFEAVTYFSPRLGDQDVLKVYDPAPDLPPLTDAKLPKLSDVTRIVIDAKGGDDSVVLGTLALGAEVHGGAGRDKLFGGMGDDTLLGGTGADQLAGYRGHDLLAGGSGDDALQGRHGPDTLLGQNGNDRLRSFGARDLLNGGAGEDVGSLLGVKGAPDAVSGIEFTGAESHYGINPVKTGVLGSTLTLRRDETGRLALVATVTLSDFGWVVDWDLIDVRKDRVDVRATFYRTTGGAAQALSGHEKIVPIGKASSSRDVRVTLDGLAGRIQRNTFNVDKDFTSKTVPAGEYP
ncbi:MAG TPA: calcium-binding protein [Tepidisphaeraceae bacterium]